MAKPDPAILAIIDKMSAIDSTGLTLYEQFIGLIIEGKTREEALKICASRVKELI